VWHLKVRATFFKPRRLYNKTDLAAAIAEALETNVTAEQLQDILNNSRSSFWSDDSAVIEVFKEEPVFDGQFSNACYEDRITEALEHFNTQRPTDFLNRWTKLVFHLPYAYHGRRIVFSNWLQWMSDSSQLHDLEAEIGSREMTDLTDWTKKAYKSKLYADFIMRRIAAGERASSDIGNMYTASIFMAFLSILSDSYDSSEDITGTAFGFIAYGSGSKSKVFEGRINKAWKAKIKNLNLFEQLNQRQAIAIDTYEDLHCGRLKTPVAGGSTIQLKGIEHEPTNYGLRRYIVK
jgi:hydroxymethylglutaryl-CoA synthase